MTKSIQVNNNTIITAKTTPLDLLDILLKNRNISDSVSFLSPPFPHSPLSPPAANTASKLIRTAISQNKNVLIYGDYDVDGITATAILWQSLYKLTKNVFPFVPHRERDGYGVKSASFFRFQEEKHLKFDLLITVDNGIVAENELAKIKAMQSAIKIIVTDHHVQSGDIKSADVVLHSTEVSGAAVSWFLARELDPDADLGLAALGTVADCLPLININRSIVVHGLQQLRLNPSPGIRKLMEIAHVNKDSLSAYDLGFILSPRINAAGRLSDPTDALRLLCSGSPQQAGKYAGILNNFNQDRQILQKEMLDSADQKINLKNKLIFKFDKNFNPGIIGLLAGRLTEKYYLPSVIMAIDDGIAKGSCRSIPELNIIDALRRHQDLFIDLGGHPGAAGFSIKTGNIKKLQKALTKTIFAKLSKIKLEPHLDVDAIMDRSAVTVKNIDTITKLAPFGIGNPEPLFLFKNLEIKTKKLIGSTGDHLKLNFGNLDAIAFKKGELYDKLNVGDLLDLAASLSLNEWNGYRLPQLIIKEILPNKTE